MHEYELLYNRWKRYRLKRIAFKFVAITVLAASIAALYHFTLTPKVSKNVKEKRIENTILPNKNFENRLSFKNFKNHTPKKSATAKKIASSKHTLLIHSQTTTLEELQKAYNAHPTAQKALIIAKHHYARKEYKEAAKWAYRANTLDKKSEESWLLFAKALAKDGKRKKAITILKIYYKKSGSPKAKLLLQKMVNGEFR